jgi:hypothetical protein
MAGVGGCTSSGPQPFESLAASLRAQAEVADRSAGIARDEQAATQAPATATVTPIADTNGMITETRGNRLNITA